MVLLSFLVLLFLDVTFNRDCHICHSCSLLFLVNHHYVWLVDQQLFICLELEVLQYLSAGVPNHLQRHLPSGVEDF